MSDNTYNGWANYETWNVNLWLQNDEGYYSHAVEILRCWSDDSGGLENFDGIAARECCMEIMGKRTPDKVALSNPDIDWGEIADAMLELAEGNDIQVRAEAN